MDRLTPRAQLALSALLLTGLLFGAIVLAGPWNPLSWLNEDLEAFRSWVLGLGPLGPLAVLLLSVAQIVVAPIPNSILGLVAAYIYGFWSGLALTALGTLIGAATAMALARRFGRPLAERFVPRAPLALFDRATASHSPLVWTAVFLLPIGDALYFAAGLTRVPLRVLLLGIAIGRLPHWVLLNLFGAAASEYGPAAWLVGLAFGAAVSLAFTLRTTRVHRRASRQQQPL